MKIAFKGLPEKQSQNSYDEIRRFGNNLLNGKMNISGEFNVSPNTTQTTVMDRNVGENSYIGITGLDEKSLSGELYIQSKNVLDKSFTIGHNSSEHSRKFSYIVVG